LWPSRCPSSAALLSNTAGVHQVVYCLWAKFPSLRSTFYYQMSFITLMDFAKSSFDYCYHNSFFPFSWFGYHRLSLLGSTVLPFNCLSFQGQLIRSVNDFFCLKIVFFFWNQLINFKDINPFKSNYYKEIMRCKFESVSLIVTPKHVIQH
jgi:hypothetical protein